MKVLLAQTLDNPKPQGAALRKGRFDWIWTFTPLVILAELIALGHGSMAWLPATPWARAAGWSFMAGLGLALAVMAWRGWLRAELNPAPGLTGAGEWHDYLQMTKPGLNGLVLVSTFVGYWMAARGSLNVPLCLSAMIGTALLAGGSAVLNQFLERQPDAMMARTARRPLPGGRLLPANALLFGVALCLGGMALLALAVNLLAAVLGTLSMACYLFIYTPLKQINSLSTLAGAICGALPPVIGWTAAGGAIDTPALVLFFILFLWQIPHFLAIAFKYRQQYEAAGFVMYSVLDPDGRATGAQAVLYTMVLVPVSAMTTWLGLTGWPYLVGALLLGAGFLIFGLRFAWQPTVSSARGLFFASIAYLPLLLTLMVLNKLPG